MIHPKFRPYKNSAPIDVIKLKPRSLKIHPHYRMPEYSIFNRKPTRIVPKIMLCGNWLEDAGFKTGQRIKVICFNKQLIITPE
jgi:hypothetical protein